MGNDHYIICGYGSTGRSSVRALRAQGIDKERVVIIELSADGAERASEDGYATIEGDAAQTAALREAHIERARAVIVAPSRDDTAVLITLTAREMNPGVTIVSGVREAENLHLLTQSGADSVIHSAEAVGRLLGMATQSTTVASVMDDLLMPGSGFDVFECDPITQDDGTYAAPEGSKVLAVVRDGEHTRLDGPIRYDDRLVVLGPENGAIGAGFVSITAAGRAVVTEFAPRLHDVLDQAIFEVLETTEIDSLVEMLQRIERAALSINDRPT